jgi:hypothetical protein
MRMIWSDTAFNAETITRLLALLFTLEELLQWRYVRNLQKSITPSSKENMARYLFVGHFKLTETITIIIVIVSVMYCISIVLYYLSIDNYQCVLG